MNPQASNCRCHELRRVKSCPPDRTLSHFSSEFQSASNLITLTDQDKPGDVSERPTPFGDGVRRLHSLFCLVAFSTTFSVLNCSFVYFVLLKQCVETPGPVMWDATKTNYIVALLSQISAILTDATIKGVLTATRPLLASRKKGSSWATWVAMGPSGWDTVLQVSAANLFLNPWCAVRLMLPVLALGIGSVVKFNANFGYYFKAANITMPVYAGLTPISTKALDMISAADLSMFLSMFGTSLLTNTMFALPFPMENCQTGCRSVALPGSLSAARQVKPQLNSSIYSDSRFQDVDTIRFDNATSMLIRYDPLSPEHLNFNLSTECVYAVQHLSNGLQICLRQSNLSLLVAWSACPKSLLDAKSCNPPGIDPAHWRTESMLSGTRMSLFRLQTTASYDKSTQTILDIQPLSDPKQIPLRAETYSAVLARALIPQLNASLEDIYGIGALIYQLTWMHRTYNKTFPGDQKSPVAMLQNLLAIPIQFVVTAEIYANYSASELGLPPLKQFQFPDEMITTARGGEASTKLIILPWAGWLFIVVDLVVHIAAVGWFGWALRGALKAKRGVGDGDVETGVAEIDGIRAAKKARVVGGEERWAWRVLKGVTKRVGWWRRREGQKVRSYAEGERLLDCILRDDRQNGKKVVGSVLKMAYRNRNLRVKEEMNESKKD